MSHTKRKYSLVEAVINTCIGLAISTAANAIVLPLYGLPFSWSAMWQISLIFTGISIVRSYYVRRFFVWLHFQGALK